MTQMDDLKKRTVISPDGEEFTVDPMKDHFCDKRPEVQPPANPILEKFFNWARSNSLWVLGWGTGCGSIELPPLTTPRFDMFRYGVQMRPTPRQAGVFII